MVRNIFVKYDWLCMVFQNRVHIYMIDYRASCLANSCGFIYELFTSNVVDVISIIRNTLLSGNLVIVDVKVTQDNVVLIAFERFNNTYKRIFKIFNYVIWMSVDRTNYQCFTVV